MFWLSCIRSTISRSGGFSRTWEGLEWLRIIRNHCHSSSFLLQLNLKFEIEVLCKNLSLDINELKPGNLLKDKDKLKNLEEQLSAPKKESKAPEEALPVSTPGAHSFPPAHSALAALLISTCSI